MSKYAKFLRLLADGKQVEVIAHGIAPGPWTDPGEAKILKYIANNIDLQYLREAPAVRIVPTYTIPTPESVAPAKGESYFVVNIPYRDLYNVQTWDGDDEDLKCLRRGIVHLTSVAAIAHAMAIIKAQGGSV